MSRLSSYQQKQFRQKLITYLVLLVGLVIFLIVIGFRLLINASIYISSLLSKKSTQTTQQSENFYGSLNVDDVPTATNSAHIIVSGSQTNYDVLEFYVNGDKAKQKEFQSSDNFIEEIGDLKVGENEVYIKAATKDGKNTKESPKFTVTYKNGAPKLDITDPSSSPTKTRKSDIHIAGKTDKEVFVKINELPIVVGADGDFQTSVSLKPGDNTITIIASDSAGNTTTKSLTVTYQND